MKRRVTAAGLIAGLVLGGLLTTGTAAAETVPLPTSMAAVGDSITQAASSGGSLGADYPQNSWSTGISSSVSSHYLRLLAAGASINGANYNRSVSGAKMVDLAGQMQNVAAVQPDYLTVLIGGNDLCTDTVAEMTSVADFRAQLAAAMAVLAAGSPGTHVYVVSIPDVYQLWSLFKGDGWARFIWSIGGVCQSLLANPTSTQQTDVQRRQQVRQRNIDFNTQLADVCAAYASTCRFDGNAVFNVQFAKSDVSGDYFHPSVAGQAKLAAVTWAAGYTWTASPPASVAPTAAFTSSCVDLTCTFTDISTDSDGTIASRSWAFGDGGTSTAASVSHTYFAAATYTVTLLVTDNAGGTGSASSPVTVTAPPATKPMWVGGMSGTSSGTRTWSATVTIAVTSNAGPVAGAVVSGTWSAGSGTTTCTTSAFGMCSVTSSSFNKKMANVTFTVANLAGDGYVYTSGSNKISSFTVAKP